MSPLLALERDWVRRCALIRKRSLSTRGLRAVLLLTAFLLVSCAPSPSAGSRGSAPSPAATTLILNGARFSDNKLGFSLAIPDGWTAQSQPGLRRSPHTSAVTLVPGDETLSHSLVQVGVLESSTMAADFTRRGAPTAHIGSYPAFSDDRTLGEARVPCLVRLFLAANDYVVADWCAMDALQHAQEFERILASYRPAASGFTAHVTTAPALATCVQVQSDFGYPASALWGRGLATPDATMPAGGWAELAPGEYLCSNTGSVEPYLFQCTELVNRYLSEQWALPHLPGNAARYFDYYQDGAVHPGVIRDIPSSIAQMSDDASQGMNAFAPHAGDLLVFQDVQDPRRGWTSGLTNSPGHVALITKVTATQVFVAQENYNDAQYFEALAVTHDAHGYHIADRSGLPNRITRGWIDFAF
jgi:hypothetical protein